MKVVVLFKEGFEEIEALSVVDVLRRVQVECLMVGMDKEEVTSSHGIKVKMDQVFDESVYDASCVVLPGGLPGATNLRDDQRVIDLLVDFNEKKKLIAAVCAGPISLEKSQVIKGRKYTCSPGFEKEIVSGIHQDVLVCVDDYIITGRGPGACWEFSYTILEKLGKDSSSLREGMQYNFLLNNGAVIK